jgi:hypothetical protein
VIDVSLAFRIVPVAALVAMLMAMTASAAVGPSLKIEGHSPLVVSGSSFAAGEKVTVTALTGLGPRVVRLTAARGGFRARFDLPKSGCAAAFGARAVGSKGSRTTVIFAKAPSCVPPPRD